MEQNKEKFFSADDYKNYAIKERLISLFIDKYASATMTRENIMWWAKNVEEDSVDDPNLEIYFPNLEERKTVVKILLKIKEIGLDN